MLKYLHIELFNPTQYRQLLSISVAVPVNDLEGIALAATTDGIPERSRGANTNTGSADIFHLQITL